MSHEKYSGRRRQVFIKKDFQLKFILKFCILILLGAIISTSLLLFFSKGTLTSSFQQSRLVIKDTASAILPGLIYTNLITLGLISVATIGVTLFISHRIAGPMFRFEKELKEVGEGCLIGSIKLRKKDEISGMADSVNKMITALHEKVVTIRSDLDQLVEKASRQDTPKGIIDELNELHRKIDTLFKV